MTENNLFVVSRTSGSSTKPCDEAFLQKVPVVDVRVFDDPKKIPAHKGTDGDWYTRGRNHRIVDGYICRDLEPMDSWCVYIDDIMDFVRQHGECVISITSGGLNKIEIYDDYRE